MGGPGPAEVFLLGKSLHWQQGLPVANVLMMKEGRRSFHQEDKGWYQVPAQRNNMATPRITSPQHPRIT